MLDDHDALENPSGPQTTETTSPSVLEIMNNAHEDQLDRLLADWASTNALNPADLDVLQRKIGERLASDPHPRTVEPATLRYSLVHRRRLLPSAVAIAAMLLIAVGLWRLGRDFNVAGDTKDVANANQHFPQPLLAVSLEHQFRLLKEYRAVFGSDLVWVVEEGGKVDVGLHVPDSAVSPPAAEYVAVQLTLLSRPVRQDDDEHDWTPVETFNVLAQREQLVEVTQDGGPLMVWAYPLDQEMVSIDLKYHPGSLADVSIDSSNLQPLGQGHSTNIHSFVKDGIEYRLYQTAELLQESDLG